MNFYTPGGVNVFSPANKINPPLRSPGVIQGAGSTPAGGTSAGALNAAYAMSAVATSAIAAYHSRAMDKIRYAAQKDALEHQRATAFQARQQQAFFAARNRDKLKESLASEQLAFQIESMKASARIENEAAAAGISNVDSVVKDFHKSSIRAQMYQEREHLNKLEASRIAAIDTQRSSQVLYEPAHAQTATSAFTQFGIDTLQIGMAAFGPQKKG